MPQFSADEIMTVCISRQVHDGEIVVQGLATPLVAAGYLLARHTHAPNLYFASAIGQGVCRQPAPMSLTRVEGLWLDLSLMNVGFVQIAADILPVLRPKEFFRPGQIDAKGNLNNIAFGKDYLTGGAPRMRLPGSGGIPDVTTFIQDIHLYVPRHSRVTFVPELDVLSGLGYSPHRRHGTGPKYLVSDLGQFDFANETLRLVSYHPGVTVNQIQAKTGFPLEISAEVTETEPPTSEEIELLRNQIDPLGIRRLELLGGAERRQALRDIMDYESRNHRQ